MEVRLDSLPEYMVLISVKANLAPCRNGCCSLSTQSSSPMSSSPPGSQCLLLFGKLGSSTREVGQNEDGDHGNGDDDSALDDEQPMPGHQLKGALK